MFDYLKSITPSEELDEEVVPALEPSNEHDLIELPEGWQLIGERKGKPYFRTAPAIAVPKPRNNPIASLLDRLPRERSEHHVGDTCPHCVGSGRYSAHRGHFHNEKCYRCDGKGVIDNKDLKYLARRLAGGEPVCRVVTA